MDERTFTGWAEPGWRAWNEMSPELEFCELAAMLARFLKPELTIETGVGQGFLTRRLVPELGPGQELLCYEADPEWRARLTRLDFWSGEQATLSANASPTREELRRATLTVLDSGGSLRREEVRAWASVAPRGSVLLVHDCGNGHAPDSRKVALARFIHGLAISGVFLSNPRGAFLGLGAAAPAEEGDAALQRAASTERREGHASGEAVRLERTEAPEAGRPASSEPLTVMVGTLHSGENEFDASCESVRGQGYPFIDHVVVSCKPKKEAHACLYEQFLRGEHDVLIKLDADMVLIEDDFVQRVVDLFAERPDVEMVSMAILDFFSGGEMFGINAYRRDVEWLPDRQSDLFTDSGFAGTPLVLGERFLHACVHSPDPSPFQAFHFGVHRGVKVALGADFNRGHRGTVQQAWYLERTWENFLIRGDLRLGLACLGFELALAGEFGYDDIDYTRPTLRRRFEEIGERSSHEVRDRVKLLRARSTEVAAVAEARSGFRDLGHHVHGMAADLERELNECKRASERLAGQLEEHRERIEQLRERVEHHRERAEQYRERFEQARDRLGVVRRDARAIRRSRTWRARRAVVRLRGGSDELERRLAHLAEVRLPAEPAAPPDREASPG